MATLRVALLLIPALLAVALAGVARAAGVPACHREISGNAAVSPAAPVAAAMSRLRFVAYQPTALRVIDGHATRAEAASIRDDLLALRPRFDGLITYDALHGAEAVAAIAAQLHYRALIIGVWDPFDRTAVDAALAAAREYPQLVVGLSLGNELVYRREHSASELAALIAALRTRAPRLALSTSEPFHIYYETAALPLLRQLDFLLANVHPVFQPWFRGASAAAGAQFVVNVVAQLRASYCGPVLVKETGVPTAPAAAGFTEPRQAEFYAALRRLLPASRARSFAYFAAFDAPWRSADSGGREAEAHWGLYDAQRRPKRVANELPLLAVSH